VEKQQKKKKKVRKIEKNQGQKKKSWNTLDSDHERGGHKKNTYP